MLMISNVYGTCEIKNKDCADIHESKDFCAPKHNEKWTYLTDEKLVTREKCLNNFCYM